MGKEHETYTVYRAGTITIQIHYLITFICILETQRVHIITLAKVAECQQEEFINLICSNLNLLT